MATDFWSQVLKETDTRQGDCGEDGNVRMAPPSLYGEGDDFVYYIPVLCVLYSSFLI
jgi:hypothetical protein